MFEFLLGFAVGMVVVGGIVVIVGAFLSAVSERNNVLQRQINAKIDELHE